MATRVCFFGKLKDAAGAAQRVIDLPASPIAISEVIEVIAGDDARLAGVLRSSHVRVIVDHVIIRSDEKITAAEEIAFLPPVSGG